MTCNVRHHHLGRLLIFGCGVVWFHLVVLSSQEEIREARMRKVWIKSGIASLHGKQKFVRRGMGKYK